MPHNIYELSGLKSLTSFIHYTPCHILVLVKIVYSRYVFGSKNMHFDDSLIIAVAWVLAQSFISTF